MQSAEQQPTIGPAHRLLDVFVGTWNVDGRTGSAAPVPNARMTSVDHYEWLPGGFFLSLRFDTKLGDGDGEHSGIGVMGYEAASLAYCTYMFDNMGFARTYRTTVRGKTWTIVGKFERATYEFSDDGRAVTIHWDMSTDGATWETLCDLKGTKVT